MSDELNKDLTDLYEKSSQGNLDPLFQRLGELDPDLPLGAAFDPAGYVEAGKTWWKRNKSVVQSYACCNPTLQKTAAKGGSKLLSAAYLLFAQHFSSGLATCAAVLFVIEVAGESLDEAVLRAFRNWCGDEWREELDHAQGD